MSIGVVLVSLLLTYFTPCSSIFIVNFEYVIPGWVIPNSLKYLFRGHRKRPVV